MLQQISLNFVTWSTTDFLLEQISKENKNQEQLLPLKEAATGGYGITVTGLPPPSKGKKAESRLEAASERSDATTILVSLFKMLFGHSSV